MSDRHDDFDGLDGFDEPRDGLPEGAFADGDPDDALLEEELRQAAAILDPVPAGLRQVAVDAFALHDLDARVAELTFDSLVDAIPVRGETDPPRMLTFRSDGVTVDVEVTADGLIGQVLPPGPAGIEVLSGPRAHARLTADDMGRFTGDAPPAGPFALRLRTGGEVVVTEWLRA
ncbi:hypothetical protein ACFWR9_05575 [Streptomyces sp. NPDC058534]|uniref:hypothetical protein n=1 Tax=Streptomyces sp. NPDC058534 TaxID=3346541 RepID=UPI003655885E